MKMTLDQVLEILTSEGKEWRCAVTKVINEIPTGYLANYGAIAELANSQYGTEIGARNVGWLRRHLYEITNRSTSLPLHRIACQGDARCEYDSERTREESIPLRRAEGTLNQPKWWYGKDA